MRKEFPLHIRKEAARLANLHKSPGDRALYNEDNIDKFYWSGMALCELLETGCEPLPKPVEPAMQFAREIRAAIYATEEFKTRSLKGDFDSSEKTRAIYALVKSTGFFE